VTAEPIPCPIWKSAAERLEGGRRHGVVVLSERAGGTYFISGTAEFEVRGLSDIEKAKLTTWIVDQNRLGAIPEITSYTINTVKALRRLSPMERSDRLLAWLAESSTDLGKALNVELGGATDLGGGSAALLAWSESLKSEEVEFLLRFLAEQGSISLTDLSDYEGFSAEVAVTVHGYMRLEQAEVGKISRQGFVAMWFSPEMQDAYDRGIAPAVLKAGYRPMRIDRKEHSNKIDDEIIAEIRKSRFVVADFTAGIVQTDNGQTTVPRGGVYYEAGFAQGLGMPVIWTVRRSQIDAVHFDTRQFNHIPWETPEDLREALVNRIVAVVGEGPEHTT
jgi:hypothetical protein